MYDEIFRLWTSVSARNQDKDTLYTKIKEYLSRLEREYSSRNGVIKKIYDLKISNLRYILESLEGAGQGEKSFKAELKQPLNKNSCERTYTENLNYIKAVEGAPVSARGKEPKYLIIRILQSIPTIIGADLKVYGPFNAEDVAALPIKNAEVLIKKNAAVEVMWGK